MTLRLLLMALVFLSLSASPAWAGKALNECVEESGRVYFTNRPCNDARQQRSVTLKPLSEINPVPADPLRGWIAAYRELARRLGLVD